MVSVYTNIAALTAQKSMSDQLSKSEQAIERLSTGLRINHAADDAAGSAIASKMEAKVRSLAVAIRNGHDAISMTQTAEGALGEMENILQRVRELAVQAGNSTLSSSDRIAIQEEVTALTNEINDIALTTNFNGVKLLDGTNSSLNFQLGVDAVDQLNVVLESSKTSDLGLTASMGTKLFTSSRIEQVDVSGIAVDAIKINGKNLVATQSATLVGTSNAAELLANAINTNTLSHGAVATAFNKVVGAEMGSSFTMTNSFSIGGVTIGVKGTMQEVVDEINESVAGVVATLGNNNSLILSNNDGGQIIVAGNAPGSVGLTADTYEGFYSLSNVDGSDVKIELGNLANGYVQAATATPTSLGSYGLNETNGEGHTKGIAVTTDILSRTDQIKINDVLVGATILDTAQAKAAAINEISAKSGVTATASTTMFLGLDFSKSPTDTSFKVNGNAIAVSSLSSVLQVASAINTANVGVIASASPAGLMQLFNSAGGNITIDLTSPVDFVSSASDADNTILTVTANITAFGNIELEATDGGFIKLEDGDLNNAGLAKLGFEAQSEMGTAGSGGVNVSTLNGATSSLANIDAAIDKVSGFRASFGAVENRIGAKINNLTTLKINTKASQSRIEDADFAAETTNMTKAQILTKAATSMLAQANASKQNLLTLLQG
ncbi:flagellin [Alphaproteobacteria bacterium]|nr:flagellin [Alphaproteobacteria bacterium]